MVGPGGVEGEGADELVVDEHGGVGVVVVDAGVAASPLDSDGDAVAADSQDAAAIDDGGGCVGRSG